MAATKRTSPSSSSYNHHHHRSPSCNLNLQLRFSPTNSNSITTVTNPKRKCLCSPTTHPGSFRCAYHRGLEKEKEKKMKEEEEKRRDVGLNLRKTALINSLVRFGSVEAERFRIGLVNSLVKPSVFNFRRKPEFTPRLSRFYALHHKDDQD